jgi:hypothetical protein
MPALLRRPLGLLIVTLAIALISSGCGDKPPAGARPTKKITVTVTYKGAPVQGAVVTFVPTEGAPAPANGITDAQGKAKMRTYRDGDGAVVASHKVTIDKSEAVGGQTVGSEDPTYDPNAAPATIKNHLPVKYNNIATSGLTAEVKEGGPAEFSFDLKD